MATETEHFCVCEAWWRETQRRQSTVWFGRGCGHLCSMNTKIRNKMACNYTSKWQPVYIWENLKCDIHAELLYYESKLIFLLHWYCTCNQASVSHFLLMISLCNSSITLKPEERGINCMWNEKPPVKYWFFAIYCMVHEAQGIDSGVKPGCDFFYFVQNITLTFLHWLLISMSKIVVHVIGFFLYKIWSEKEWKVAEFDALIKPVEFWQCR